MQAGSYIPLTNIGPDHSDWGMAIENNAPVVKDRARQHASYLEAGSFGEFLITAYGTEKMKQFNRLSKNALRPWEKVFGSSLEQLETRWHEWLKSRTARRRGNVATLAGLIKKDPTTACFAAQKLAVKK